MHNIQVIITTHAGLKSESLSFHECVTKNQCRHSDTIVLQLGPNMFKFY